MNFCIGRTSRLSRHRPATKFTTTTHQRFLLQDVGNRSYPEEDLRKIDPGRFQREGTKVLPGRGCLRSKKGKYKRTLFLKEMAELWLEYRQIWKITRRGTQIYGTLRLQLQSADIFDFDINQIAIILHHCIAFLGIVLWLKEPHH